MRGLGEKIGNLLPLKSPGSGAGNGDRLPLLEVGG